MKRYYESGLGDLVDPSKYTHPINIEGLSREASGTYLKMMMTIRFVEERIGDLVSEGKAICPCHLNIGQEAIATGISRHLRTDDRIFGGHRSHAHYLALGGSMNALFAEILGKVTGCSKGMGGSMHLQQEDKGFMGSVPIVGATIPVAVGAALAAKMNGRDSIAVCYFGDGAAEEGALHESLNLASNLRLPVLFVCENNLFASHMDISLRQPSDKIARFAQAHRIAFDVVDGNDIVAVDQSARQLIKDCREKRSPGFLEAVSYRWRGHVGPREDFDVGVRRKKEDVDAWKRRDPIRRLFDAMLNAEYMTVAEYDALVTSIQTQIDSALLAADSAPYPDESALIDLVYCNG